jgi:hypothetical protein
MSRPFRSFLAAAGVVLLVPATGAAAGWQEGPVPPSDDLTPPPSTAPAEPDPVEPGGPSSLTITVPPVSLAKPAPKAKPTPAKAEAAQAAPTRRTTPRRVRSAEPSVEHHVLVAPAVEQAPERQAAPKARRARARAKPARPQPRVVAKVVTPVRTIRDPEPAGAVLAAQFSLDQGSGSGAMKTVVLLLAVALAAVLGALVAAVGAAPLLADRWPSVFVPVIDATERIVLTGVCLAGAALTLMITWALTGPGG